MTPPPAAQPDLDRLDRIAQRARAVDGFAPFSDGMWSAATRDPDRVRWRRDADGTVVAAAVVAPLGERMTGELVVDPAHRRRGHGGRLLADVLAHTDGPLWLWAHGDHPGAAALARRHGLRRARSLLQLRRPVGQAAPPLPDVRLPDDVRLRTFVIGQDEEAWLAVNNAAFAWHPEQGRLGLDDIRAAQARADFDPAGFFLAVDGEDQVLGFHWTKVHETDPTPGLGGSAGRLGEVYVVGVDPNAHRSGLGTALTVAGLRYLADVAGVTTVMLYVEGDNAPARRLYERLGFTPHVTDVAYLRE